MKYKPQQYALALYESLQGKAAPEADGIMDNFFALMNKNRDLGLARKAIDAFGDCARRREGIFSGELASARPLSAGVKAEIINKITDVISTQRKMPVKKIELKEKLDADLIGGCRVRVGDILINMSVSGMLEKIRKEL